MRRTKLRAKKLMKNGIITAVTYQAGSFGLSCIWFIFVLQKYVKGKKAKKLAKNDTEPVAPVFFDESQILLLMT